jgi:transposase
MKELQMTLKEADRLFVIRRLKDKKINLKKAAQELGLCIKQCYRLLQRFIKNGPQGLISLRRGKPSNNHLDYDFVHKIVAVIKEKYFDYGPTLIKEKLEEKHNLYLSKETIRQIIIKEGLWTPNKVKDKKNTS